MVYGKCSDLNGSKNLAAIDGESLGSDLDPRYDVCSECSDPKLKPRIPRNLVVLFRSFSEKRDKKIQEEDGPFSLKKHLPKQMDVSENRGTPKWKVTW